MEKRKGYMAAQLLLLEDVDNLGRSGELVQVKPGYARNFLIPQKKALVADRNTLRMQTRLREERAKRAAVDREIAEAIASRAGGITLAVEVKVDPEGNMYGSVTPADIVELFAKQGIEIERRNVFLPHVLKTLGMHELDLRLKEGVTCSFRLKIRAEGAVDIEDLPALETTEASEE
jgi:large subunit ribosomal protein L9